MSSSKVISQACGECRARKIKCDLQHPSCNRCIRSGRQCPGYRDQLALWFRDESQTVAQRAKATTHSSPSVGRRTQRSLMEEAFEKALNSNELAQRGELFLLPIDLFMVDVQDVATCYFFEVFDWVGASTLVEGSFDYKKDSSNAPLGEQALLAGITAVGKASLANINQSDTLRELASDDYVTTLSLVSTAIRHSQQSCEESTLIAIFLLSIFEMIAGQDRKSIDNCLNHLIGASKLLESREPASFSKISSPEIFYGLRSAIVTCSICRKLPVPTVIVKLSNQIASTTRDPLSAALRDLTSIIADLANIRHMIDKNEVDDSQNILNDLISIDHKLEEWVDSISPSCYYDSASTPRPFQVTRDISLKSYKEYSHRYPNFWIANMWNEFRTTKFKIYDMMLTQLRPSVTDEPSSEGARKQCLEISKRMAQISEDICCSVPYILGLITQEWRESSQPVARNSSGAFVLLWPLTVAAFAHKSSYPVSEFVNRCFEVISRGMGIQQAAVFRDWAYSSLEKYAWIGSS